MTWGSSQEQREYREVDTRHRAHLTGYQGGNVISDLVHDHGHDRGETRSGINLVKGADQSRVHGM